MLAAGILMGIQIGIYGSWYYYQQKKDQADRWRELNQQKIIYRIRDVKSYSRYGRPVRQWSDIKEGKVWDVNPDKKIIRINGKWYKTADIKIID